MTIKTLDYYLTLAYTMIIKPDPEDGGWFIEIRELEGCMSQADRWEDVLPMIREAMELWLSVSMEYGDPIPEPQRVEAAAGD